MTSALLLALLILVSAFFSGSEIALFSLSQARARALVDEGRWGAEALAELKGDPERLLVTILIGNNVANISAASVSTYAATQAFGSAGVGLATGVVTVLVLFFGEITPKSLAVARAVQFSLVASPIIRWMERLLFFLVRPTAAATRALMPKRSGPGQRITEGEIRRMTQLGTVSGEIEPHEREIIERAFHLDTTEAWEIMTPRVDVFAWPDDRRLADITRELRTVPFSRIPVYGESLDDITGVLYVRDAYQALISGQRDVRLSGLARDPLFVPETVPLVRLLRDFQARRIHLGIVVDEYGGTDGLVTLEDILEELVGEIVDEMDVPEEPIVRVDRNVIRVDGSAELRELNHFFNTSFPLLEHRSLNGYLLDELGRVPAPGESVEREGVHIEVLDATDTQVVRARLTRLHPSRKEGEEPRAGPAAARTRGEEAKREEEEADPVEPPREPPVAGAEGEGR